MCFSRSCLFLFGLSLFSFLYFSSIVCSSVTFLCNSSKGRPMPKLLCVWGRGSGGGEESVNFRVPKSY